METAGLVAGVRAGETRAVARAISHKVMDLAVRPNIARQLDYMEAELGRSPWFAGDELSGADIMMSFPLEAAGSRVPYGPDKAKLKAFLQKIHARPAYQRALERGGPYSYA